MSSPGTVLVTGASGYLSGHVISQLLSKGYRVRGTLRSTDKAEKFKSQYGGNVETRVVPDIAVEGAFNDTLDGVDFIVHTASPFTFTIEDIQKDLLLPAIQGTAQILKAAAACPSIKRVVITSSFAAVVNPFLGPRQGYVYTEKDWNPLTSDQALESNLFGYQASKTFAEKAAWDFLAAEKPDFTVVTICPPMIFGPVLKPMKSESDLNESSAQLRRNVKTPMETRMPVFVDVRDVARAHVESLDLTKVTQSERFLVCGGKYTWAAAKEIAENRPVSEKSMESSNDYYCIDTAKVEKMLGIKWTSLEQCIRDSLKAMKGLSNL